MNDIEQRKAAKAFVEHWQGKGYEKGESQPFWLELLHDVYGVENPAQFIRFEEQVHLDHTSFIDGHIESTKVLIEQKGSGKSLTQAIKQSDGSLLTPFQQAKRYITELPVSQHPRWVVTCNFTEFFIYDMEKPGGEPEVIYLKDLAKDYYRLQFLVDEADENIKKEMEISLKAGDIVGVLYDALLSEYKDANNEDSLKSLNMLCVRLVFCLYAEDAGVFGKRNMFHDYMRQFSAKQWREALIELFKVLDTRVEDRDPYIEDDLAEFPYVNGGLFEKEDIEIPRFTDEIVSIIMEKASEDFDWSEISPTIFGAVFESTLNPETRRAGGMHYTSIENIHKLIDPLFLDELTNELDTILSISQIRTKKDKLDKYQDKLASLKFLDPACGSGNFLTETYLSIRRLENKVIKEKVAIDKGQIGGQMLMGTAMTNPIKVSISQFYGIEINDFAVTVAKTALWIAESQMMKETEDIIFGHIDFLPLKTNAYIREGNALRLDWADVINPLELDYIMGNPPFIGFTYMTESQKADMQEIFPNVKNLDYVCGWYKKASEFMDSYKISAAFVSTNSIVQGETVARFWSFLPNVVINFAYQSFVWNSEAKEKAAVHCIIIGFANYSTGDKYLFGVGTKNKVHNINRYLLDGEDIIVESRNKPLCKVPKMIYGNKPADGGNLIVEAEDYDEFIKKDPNALKFIKPLLGASEYIKGKKRWCIWLDGVSPSEIRKSPLVMERVKKCKEVREASKAAGIRKFAETPTLFAQRTQPVEKDFIIIPRVSSQNRRYIPMGFIKAGTIVSDSVQIVPDASVYDFGVLSSNVHMAWMRVVAGRLKSDYRYSKDIVYNNFPWCTPTPEQKAKIEETAQGILDARALYPDSSLADLYDELTMPVELRKAHQLNDMAVMKAYGFTKDTEAYQSESACVAELMKMYQKLTEE